MASQGKRMVPEYLIKYLEGLYNSGIDPTGFQPKLTAGDGIAIDEDNEITFDSETAAPLMENIVDSAGNKRFIEGDITLNSILIGQGFLCNLNYQIILNNSTTFK